MGANTWKEVRGGKSPGQGGGVSRAEGARGGRRRGNGEPTWASKKTDEAKCVKEPP